MQHSVTNTKGSVLLWTVMVVTILSTIAATLVGVVTTKYQNATQTAIWQESLLAAESGVDLAIVELRKSLYPPPNNAWSGWNAVPGNGVTSYGLTTVPNAGFAGTTMTVETNVDAPVTLKDPGNGWQYYRIRALGTMPITGPARPTDNKQDGKLHKLTLRRDRLTGVAVTQQTGNTARATRRIEAIVRPVSSFDLALLSMGTLDLTNQNIEIDSYDSRDPRKSRNGLYPYDDRNADGSLKRQENGDIATDGNLISAGNAHIYGDVATNSGTVSGAANITGVERTDFYQEAIPKDAPSWPLGSYTTFSTISNTTSLPASASSSSPARYRLDGISLSGNASKILTIAGDHPTPPALPAQRYVEIYVTGNISVSGNTQIKVEPGVSAVIYFKGDVDVAGNGIINDNNQPGDLLMYGIQPAPGDTRNYEVKLGGNGRISAAVYAPNHAVTINGGGTDGHVFGSAVGKTVKMTGVTNLHYDEALGSGGFPSSYKIVSWFEDTR